MSQGFCDAQWRGEIEQMWVADICCKFLGNWVEVGKNLGWWDMVGDFVQTGGCGK